MDVLADGDRVNTSLLSSNASIPGTFGEPTDTFDPSRRYVRLNVNPGKYIGDIAYEIEVDKIQSDTRTVRPNGTNHSMSQDYVTKFQHNIRK